MSFKKSVLRKALQERAFGNEHFERAFRERACREGSVSKKSKEGGVKQER